MYLLYYIEKKPDQGSYKKFLQNVIDYNIGVGSSVKISNLILLKVKKPWNLFLRQSK